MIPACASVNIRTSPSTGAAIKVRLTPSDRVTVSGSLASSAWSTVCAGAKSGSTWYRVTHVNGQAVATRYGVASLYAATGVLTTASGAGATPAAAPPTPAPTAVPPTSAPAPATPAPTPAPTTVPAPAPAAAPLTGQVLAPACDGVNLRASPSTRATIKVRLGLANTITVDGTVAGSSWSTACPTAKSGSTWYRVSQVNGRPVSELYGAATIYAATGVLSDSVTAATPGVTTLGAVTTFYGRGYGHGVGMSQYGARGRALAGQTAAQILAHYYANTTLGSIAADTAIRVLVLDDFTPTAAAPLVIYGRSGPWTVSGVDLEFPADARLRLFPPASATTGSWRLLVESAAGQVLFDGPTSAAIRVRGTSDATLIQLYSKPSAYDHYRGALQVLPTGASVDVVNQLPLETYLRGVVPAEMPSSWPLEARIAQTIAARSFAAYQLRPTTGTFDVYDDTRDQVYGGVRRETAEADAVVAATTGQVLRSGSSIVNALFHSTGGGGTENNEDVFVSSTGGRVAGPVTYLRGSSDRDSAGVPYDTGAPYATWQTRAYTTAELSAIFAADSRTNVGTLTALDLRNRGVSGRLVSVTLVGSSGTKMVSGAVFIAVFNANRLAADGPLRSTLFDVAPIP
jgi:SpoIID/LytB domain protein